jgi:hypothetical protein
MQPIHPTQGMKEFLQGLGLGLQLELDYIDVDSKEGSGWVIRRYFSKVLGLGLGLYGLL